MIAAHASDLNGYPHEVLMLIDLSGSANLRRHHPLIDLRRTWWNWRIRRSYPFFLRSMHLISTIEIKRRTLSSQFFTRKRKPFSLPFTPLRKTFLLWFFMIKIRSNLIFHTENHIKSWDLKKLKREIQEKNHSSLFFSLFLLDQELKKAPNTQPDFFNIFLQILILKIRFNLIFILIKNKKKI